MKKGGCMKQLNNNYSFEINNNGSIASLRFLSCASNVFSSKIIEAIEIRRKNCFDYIRIFEKVTTKGYKHSDLSGKIEYETFENFKCNELLDDDEIINILSII